MVVGAAGVTREVGVLHSLCHLCLGRNVAVVAFDVARSTRAESAARAQQDAQTAPPPAHKHMHATTCIESAAKTPSPKP